MKPVAIDVRPAKNEDAAALADLLNGIIAKGGTTAHEELFSAERLRAHFISGVGCLTCFVAVDAMGQPIGFQAMGLLDRAPGLWGDIGTFTRVGLQAKGVGSALFAATLAVAKSKGVKAINATIRADNAGGLAYYGRMGFEDASVTVGVPLKDGTPVDRINKVFWVN